MKNNLSVKIILWIAGLILLTGLPHVIGIYYTNMVVAFAIFSVFALSLNMLLGFTGLLSFGHAMFFGMGGYGTALALTHIPGLAVIPAVGIGAATAVLLALILSPLVVRVSGTAFAMLHLAFGQLLFVVALKLYKITGGEDGIGNFPMPGLFTESLSTSPVHFYYLAMIILGLCVWLMWFVTKTPFGQIQVGIRDNARRIDYLGYQVPQTKAVVYVLSAFFAGIAGSLYGLSHNLVSAEGSLGLWMSFYPIIATMIGGVGSFFGPILGVAVFQGIDELILRYTESTELVMGVILILVVMFLPAGLMGFISSLMLRLKSRSCKNQS
ncbi:MAG TPA: branched-chain amino acid ABC transporter permease [Smithellaceae bacterium]|nr:branched-chain amino acid ABC transporter permease [Smithellaceae bacterium]